MSDTLSIPAEAARVRRPASPSLDMRARSPPLPGMRDESHLQRWSEKGAARTAKTAQPMRDVILLGLDPDVDAEKLRTLVTTLADAVEARLAAPPQDVTVIRDRNSGASKGFGFAKFETLEDAQRFVMAHAPFITNPETWLGTLPDAAQGGKMRRKRIKVDYSNSERPQGGMSYYEQHNAPGCREQRRSRHRRGREGDSVDMRHEQLDQHNENAGLRAASAVETNMLLLTNVDADVDAADVGQLLASLPGTVLSEASELATALGALDQVMLVRDRASGASKQCAFALFHARDAAKTCLSALRNRTAFPQGASVKYTPLRTSYADTIVFEEADAYDPTSAPWTYTDGAKQTWRHEDESLGLEVWTPSMPATPSATSSGLSTPQALDTLPLPAVSLAQPTPAAAVRTTNFSDPVRRICMLCQRQFKSHEMLARHATESALHRTNLGNEHVYRAGVERVHAYASLPTQENTTHAAPAAKAGAFHPPRRHALQPMGWNTDDMDALAFGRLPSPCSMPKQVPAPHFTPLSMMYPPA